MRFNFRKIASTITSTLMVGSTVALAAAANYPAPFVQNGNADVAIVYGSNAASTDLVAAADIAANLGNALTAQGGTGSVTIEGESYPLFGSGDSKIYHNDTLNSQRTSVTDSDLPTVLADSEISGNVDSDITTIVTVGNFPRFKYAQQPTSDNDPEWGLELSTSAANSLYNVSVIFDQAVDFTHSDTEGETFTMMGQQFTVSSATDSDTLVLFRASESVFLDSASNPSQTVQIDGTTYTIELVAASDTSATIRITDSSGASDQKEINEAASKKIRGLDVSVITADESDALGTISAEVIVGAAKLTLENGNEVLFGADDEAIEGTRVSWDSTRTPANLTQLTFQVTADDSDEDAILPGQSFVDPIFASFALTFANLAGDNERETIMVDNSGDEKMTVQFTGHTGDDSGSLNWVYNETDRIVHPSAVTSGVPILAVENDGLIHYGENVIVNQSHYVILSDSEEDDGYFLKVENIQNGSSGTGSDEVRFVDEISGSTYTLSISTEGTGTLNLEGTSYTVNYWGASGASEESMFVRIDDPATSTGGVRLFPTIETESGAKIAFYQPTRINLDTYGGFLTGAQNVSSIQLPDGDGFTAFTVVNAYQGSGSTWTIGGNNVNATIAGSSVNVTSGRLTWAFAGNSQGLADNSTVDLYLLTPGTGARLDEPALIVFEEEDDNNNYEAMVVELEGMGTDSDGLGVSTAHRTSLSSGGFGPTGFITHESDSDISSTATLWGSIITLDAGESDQKTLTISYPDEQVNAELYVNEADGVTSNGGNLGSVSVMDSEVSQVSSKNLIVIGGSCVNTVAASLLGSDRPLCGADFEQRAVGAGSFLIQSFQSPYTASKIAVLVAGYNAADTTNAATALRTQSIDTTVGKKYTGNSATSVTLQ